MRPQLLAILLLVGCGDRYAKPWAGTCTSSIGDLGLSTGQLILSEGAAPQWSGDHSYYTGSGTVVFPESTQELSVDVVICDDANGCDAPTADYADGELIAVFSDSSGNARLTGSGPLKGREVVGSCTSQFGPGDFSFGPGAKEK